MGPLISMACRRPLCFLGAFPLDLADVVTLQAYGALSHQHIVADEIVGVSWASTTTPTTFIIGT